MNINRTTLPAARPSNRLSESLVAPALAAGGDRRPGRATRSDGWTPDRIRIFLNALAECGVVEDAARAAGMTLQSAYALRRRAEGRAFHVAWNAAQQIARRRIADALMSRALNGCVEVIVRDGKLWGERHRYDNRLTLALLTRLDKQVLASDSENRDARVVAEEFDEFVDLVCAGGASADRFLEVRREAERRIWSTRREAVLMRRLLSYRRTGAGLAGSGDADDAGGPEPDWLATLEALAESAAALVAEEAGQAAPVPRLPAESEESDGNPKLD